jgi:hypothetical protein
MQPPKRKKTRRGKRKTPRCRTGRRHTPNAPDPNLDCEGVPWCISDTTEKSIKFTDFDAESTKPSCMPLVYWSTQTTAAINLLRPQQSTNTVYLPYVSTANAAALITQQPAPTQLDDIMRDITDEIKLDHNTRFDKIIAKLDNNIDTAIDNIVGDNRLLEDNG